MNEHVSHMHILINAYVDSASRHGWATQNGDSESANAAADELARLRIELRSSAGDVELVALLGHDDPSVRVWAASHTLHGAPALAEQALESVAALGGLIGFGARQTLNEWRTNPSAFK